MAPDVPLPEAPVIFRQLFDRETSTYTYLLGCPRTREAVIIDPVRDQVERDLEVVADLGLRLVYAVDTHVHADHVTASGVLRSRTGLRTVVGAGAGTPCADLLVQDGDTIPFGDHALEVRATPGHTDGCVTYVTTDHAMAFTGDALLIRGCGRTDFQQGDPRRLYRSIHDKVFSLPDSTFIYPGHDYKGRTVSTVGEEKAHNPRLGGGRTEDAFVEIMAGLKLAYPGKIDIAVPANQRCGWLPGDGAHAAEAPPERAWAPVVRDANGVPEVEAGWTAGHLTEFRVVDVREPAEFDGELGHVPGAELVPLATVATAAAAWDRAEPLVVVCRSGGRSGRAATALEQLGFKRVASMAGGMLRWNALGQPISRS